MSNCYICTVCGDEVYSSYVIDNNFDGSNYYATVELVCECGNRWLVEETFEFKNARRVDAENS
jgi:DNA-directed RNA polymerase subunit RPC12/RpoP